MSRPLRVVQAIPSLDPAGGGPPVVVASLAAAQAAAGANVTLAHGSDPAAEERVTGLLAGIPGIDRVTLVHGTLAAALGSGAAPDAVHLHGFWERWLFAGAKAARHAGVPTVLTPHGMLHPWSMQQKRIKKAVAMRLGYAGMLRRAAMVHALNEPERQILLWIDPKANVRVIPNGIFLESFASLPARGEFRRRHPELTEGPLVLFISRLHYKKGLDILAEAFAMLLKTRPDARLVVIGPDGGYEAAFRQHAERLGIAKQTTMPGPQYGHAKLAALCDADCFCLPSRQEGFSIAITEALACGAPCVVSRDCNYPEVAEAGAGVVTSLDPAEVARGIESVLTGDDARSRLGGAGRELVATRFTWPRIAETAFEAYSASGIGP
ncbi:MAG: glycosyltransferase [Planctomycetota bacterium]